MTAAETVTPTSFCVIDACPTRQKPSPKTEFAVREIWSVGQSFWISPVMKTPRPSVMMIAESTSWRFRKSTCCSTSPISGLKTKTTISAETMRFDPVGAGRVRSELPVEVRGERRLVAEGEVEDAGDPVRDDEAERREDVDHRRRDDGDEDGRLEHGRFGTGRRSRARDDGGARARCAPPSPVSYGLKRILLVAGSISTPQSNAGAFAALTSRVTLPLSHWRLVRHGFGLLPVV